MALAWRVILLDRSSGSDVEYDTTALGWYDHMASSIQRPSFLKQGTTTIVLHIPYRFFGDWDQHIQGLFEIWAGFRDTVSGEWADDDFHVGQLFGGYIRIVRRETRVADFEGEVTYTLTVDSYGVLLRKTAVHGFPEDVLRYPGDHATAEFPVALIKGYPPGLPDSGIGFTVMDWLVGTTGEGKPYDGLIPQRLGGYRYGGTLLGVPVDLNGVDNRFSGGPGISMILDATARPKNTSVQGYLEGLDLDTAIQLVLSSAIILNVDSDTPVRPGYYMKPIIDPDDGTRIKPQFVCKDLNDPATAMWVFTDDPSLGGDNYWDYWDERETSDLFTKVSVLGFASYTINEPIAAGGTAQNRYRVYTENVDYLNNGPTGVSSPPVKYQTDEGWELFIYSERITTIGGGVNPTTGVHDKMGAIAIAKAVARNLAEGIFTLGFTTTNEVEEGDVINIKNDAAGVQGNFPVTEVDVVIEERRTVRKVTCGWYKYALTDIINGPLMDLVEQAGSGFYRQRIEGQPSFGNAWAGVRGWLTAVPEGNGRNVIQALSADVNPLHIKAAVNYDKAHATTPDGTNIDPADYNFVDPSQFSGMPPQPLVQLTNELGKPIGWVFADGTGGPKHIDATFEENRDYPISMPAGSSFTGILIMHEYDAANNVLGYLDLFADPPTPTLITPGITFTIDKWNHALGTPPGSAPGYEGPHANTEYSADNPLPVQLGDSLKVTVAGLPAGHSIGVIITEALPNAFDVVGP